MKRFLIAVTLSVMVAASTGCNDWERTTFNTLGASKAVIDQAQADYESRKIPHNQCDYDIINKAKAGQSVAVEALMTYEGAKTQQAQSVVIADLALLGPVIVQIKTISAGSACTATSSLTSPQSDNAVSYGDNSPAITGSGNVVKVNSK